MKNLMIKGVAYLILTQIQRPHFTRAALTWETKAVKSRLHKVWSYPEIPANTIRLYKENSELNVLGEL